MQDQLRVEAVTDERSIIIEECRPPWRKDANDEWSRQPVARLRYIKCRSEWSLYWSDSGLRWRPYGLTSDRGIRPLLHAIERDEDALFWG